MWEIGREVVDLCDKVPVCFVRSLHVGSLNILGLILRLFLLFFFKCQRSTCASRPHTNSCCGAPMAEPRHVTSRSQAAFDIGTSFLPVREEAGRLLRLF